jgi:hypothetical protein
MGRNREIQRRLIEGAAKGFRSGRLFDFVRERVPDAPTQTIVHSAAFALTDPAVTDRSTLDAIYDLAVASRAGERNQSRPLKPEMTANDCGEPDEPDLSERF